MAAGELDAPSSTHQPQPGILSKSSSIPASSSSRNDGTELAIRSIMIQARRRQSCGGTCSSASCLLNHASHVSPAAVMYTSQTLSLTLSLS